MYVYWQNIHFHCADMHHQEISSIVPKYPFDLEFKIIIEKYGHTFIIGTKIRSKTPFCCDVFVEFRVQICVL